MASRLAPPYSAVAVLNLFGAALIGKWWTDYYRPPHGTHSPFRVFVAMCTYAPLSMYRTARCTAESSLLPETARHRPHAIESGDVVPGMQSCSRLPTLPAMM